MRNRCSRPAFVSSRVSTTDVDVSVSEFARDLSATLAAAALDGSLADSLVAAPDAPDAPTAVDTAAVALDYAAGDRDCCACRRRRRSTRPNDDAATAAGVVVRRLSTRDVDFSEARGSGLLWLHRSVIADGVVSGDSAPWSPGVQQRGALELLTTERCAQPARDGADVELGKEAVVASTAVRGAASRAWGAAANRPHGSAVVEVGERPAIKRQVGHDECARRLLFRGVERGGEKPRDGARGARVAAQRKVVLDKRTSAPSN